MPEGWLLESSPKWSEICPLIILVYLGRNPPWNYHSTRKVMVGRDYLPFGSQPREGIPGAAPTNRRLSTSKWVKMRNQSSGSRSIVFLGSHESFIFVGGCKGITTPMFRPKKPDHCSMGCCGSLNGKSFHPLTIGFFDHQFPGFSV